MNPDVRDLHKALLSEHQDARSKLGGDSAYAKTAPVLGESANIEASTLKQPGGFRRHHLNREADERGVPYAQRPTSWQQSLVKSVRPLIRVGYFNRVLGVGTRVDERGECGQMQTAAAILKSFVGSGVLFMPGAVAQAGWAVSSVTIVIVALLNAVCVRLLLDSIEHTGINSFGDLAFRAAGRLGRESVHAMLIICQFASVICYFTFIAQTMESAGFLAALGLTPTSVVLLELAIMAPLGLLRSVEQLEYPILLADAFILFGLGTVLWLLVDELEAHGPSPSASAASLGGLGPFLGTALFTFEGLPLVLPIRNEMAQPELFWPLFCKCFVAIVALFVAFGVCGYLAYGASTAPVLLSSISTGGELMLVVRVLYIIALTLSSPLVFIPAARITELWAFGANPKGRFWAANALRVAEYVGFAAVALWANSDDESFQLFLGIAGVVSGAPIAFIFPAYIYLRTMPTSAGPFGRAVAVGCICFGVAAFVLVAFQTVGALL